MIVKLGERAEKARIRARLWYANNRDRAIKRALQVAHDNRDAAKARAKAWYEKNKPRALDAQRAYRKKNSEQVSKYLKEYRAANHERVAALKRNYKIRKRGAEGSHSGADIKSLFLSQSGLCNVCRAELCKYHVDHIMPLILGGSNYPDNLQLLCAPCNLSKRSIHPDEFMRRVSLRST